jgi:hypothetical protein
MANRLFGTAGIRGVTNADITADLALRLARAYGDWIHANARRCGDRDVQWSVGAPGKLPPEATVQGIGHRKHRSSQGV